MNKLLTVNSENLDMKYDIKVNSDFSELSDFFYNISRNGQKNYARICIVTDSNVAKIYLKEVSDILKSLNHDVYSHVFDAGETSKNFNVLNKLYEDLIINRFDRGDLLIALGGGVVGDLTGYCAATYLRGIDYIQVPTSLLSQVDSSIGGKTAIDFLKYKNMVGAFYMPKLVYINTSTLNTLDDMQFSAGMGEIIKHGLIADRAYYDFIDAKKHEINSKASDSLIELVYGSCLIKSGVVEKDPKEKGIRAYLNFGHTIGHAIEKLSDYKLLHGQCVSIGIMAAMYISEKLGNISVSDLEKAGEMLEYFDLPTTLSGLDIPAEAILDATKSDKKMRSGKIKFVVLKSVGEAAINNDVDDSLLLEAIEYILG